MPKNNTTRGLTVLFFSSLLWGCASDDAEEENIWSSTDNIYSAASISSSKASIGTNGDIVIVWQEQETEVRDDTVKDTAHTFVGTPAAPDSHATEHVHKLLYTRTTVNVKTYDSSAGSWRATIALNTGFWEKSKSGLVDLDDATDESKIVYEENSNITFVGDFAASTNYYGDAVVAWVQLGESTVTTGDANTSHNLFAYVYNAASNSLSTRSIVP